MAYGNWGAEVYRNGERMEAWEDQTPYKEQDYEPGYAQSFGIAKLSEALAAVKTGNAIPESAKLNRERERVHHAVLGEKEVRLCGHKSYALLYLRGDSIDLTPYEQGDGVYESDISGEIEGEGGTYRFRAASIEEPEAIALALLEPDGTLWRSHCGYMIGSGHDEPAREPTWLVIEE